MSIIPPPDEWSRTSVSLPKRLWADLEKELEQVNKDRPPPEKFSRDRFIQVSLEWVVRELRAERATKKK